jgi:hypothetical protein
MLAKMQWDTRHGPAAPSKTCSLTQMVSPCVAGDLLQQVAPGLVPHVRPSKRTAQATSTEATDMMRGLPPAHIAIFLLKLRDYYVAAASVGSKLADLGELKQNTLQSGRCSGCLCRMVCGMGCACRTSVL